MTRIALLVAAALGLACVGPAPASAQFFSCAQVEDPTQRMNCYRWQEPQLRRQLEQQAPAAPVPQTTSRTPTPGECDSLALAADRTACLHLRSERQGLLAQRKLHEDAIVMSVATQRALLQCLHGSSDASRLVCYEALVHSTDPGRDGPRAQAATR